jgi:hypothetical protein
VLIVRSLLSKEQKNIIQQNADYECSIWGVRLGAPRVVLSPYIKSRDTWDAGTKFPKKQQDVTFSNRFPLHLGAGGAEMHFCLRRKLTWQNSDRLVMIDVSRSAPTEASGETLATNIEVSQRLTYEHSTSSSLRHSISAKTIGGLL